MSTQLALQSTADGTVLPVRAQAGSRRQGLLSVYAGAIKVAVNAAPERGKANDAILAELASRLQIPRARLEILSGHTSPQKRILVRNMKPEELQAKVYAVLEGGG